MIIDVAVALERQAAEAAAVRAAERGVQSSAPSPVGA